MVGAGQLVTVFHILKTRGAPGAKAVCWAKSFLES